jgi:hypothetical protein
MKLKKKLYLVKIIEKILLIDSYFDQQTKMYLLTEKFILKIN